MKKYDVIVIGLGPAGMAVSVMASEMGLKVLGIEKNKLGGECMNVGCIPSKGILKISEKDPTAAKPFARVAEHIAFISEKKTKGMFDKVDVLLGQGAASFVNSKTVQVGDKQYTAKYLFIATGTSPMVPPMS